MKRQLLNPGNSVRYRIYMQGIFNVYWLKLLSGVWAITPLDSRYDDVTILVGSVTDQAVLMRDLEQIYRLGLPLLRIELLAEEA